MIKEVSRDVWETQLKEKPNSEFFNSSFLDLIAESFRYKIHYFVYEEKGRILMVAALYSHKKSIVTALPYTYSSIWFEKKISDRKYLLIGNSFIRYLKARWKKISLRLPIEVTDIRPFIWGGFKVSNRYTYLKETDTEYHKSFLRNKEKAKKNGMTFSVSKPTQHDIENCYTGLSRQIFNKDILLANIKTLTGLAAENQLLAFKCFVDNLLVCTSLMLVDFAKHKAYALIITDSKKEFGHTFINVERTNWCNKNGIKEIDLCGASEPGFADFKSFINGQLKLYFIVHYNPRYNFLNLQIGAFKGIIKRILRW